MAGNPNSAFSISPIVSFTSVDISLIPQGANLQLMVERKFNRRVF
jgi:hypothetical protein